MNQEIFSALSRNVGQLRRMKKAHEDMGTDIAVLRIENNDLRRKFFHHIIFSTSLCFAEIFPDYLRYIWLFSTDALAEAKEALANGCNAQILREENQELFQENRKLKSDLESAQKLLKTTQSRAKEQAERDAENIRLGPRPCSVMCSRGCCAEEEYSNVCGEFLCLGWCCVLGLSDEAHQ